MCSARSLPQEEDRCQIVRVNKTVSNLATHPAFSFQKCIWQQRTATCTSLTTCITENLKVPSLLPAPLVTLCKIPLPKRSAYPGTTRATSCTESTCWPGVSCCGDAFSPESLACLDKQDPKLVQKVSAALQNNQIKTKNPDSPTHLPELAASSSTPSPPRSPLPSLLRSSQLAAKAAAASPRAAFTLHSETIGLPTPHFLRRTTLPLVYFYVPLETSELSVQLPAVWQRMQEGFKATAHFTCNVNKWGTCRWRREASLASTQVEGCGAYSICCLITANLHNDTK